MKTLRSPVRALAGWSRRPWAGSAAAGGTAAVLAFVSLGTYGTVYDVDATGFAIAPFVAAMVGLPFAAVLRRPLTGLLVSVASAYVLAVTLPLHDRDPWPWLVVHGG